MGAMIIYLLLQGAVATAADAVRVEVASDQPPASGAFVVQTAWLAEPQTWELRDDGVPPDTRAGDGVWTGGGSGDEVRTLSLTLSTPDADTPLWSGTERLAAGAQRLVFSLEHDGPTPRVHRSAVALPGPSMEVAEASSVAALLGWAALVLVYVLGIVAWSTGRGRR